MVHLCAASGRGVNSIGQDTKHTCRSEGAGERIRLACFQFPNKLALCRSLSAWEWLICVLRLGEASYQARTLR
jgi:hypothetical protein